MKTKRKSYPIYWVVIITVFISIATSFLVNQKRPSSVDTALLPTETPELIKANFKYTTPKGWVVEKNIEDVTEFVQTEVVTFKNGKYELRIGRGTTGYSRCDEYYNQNINNNLKQLTNEQLGNPVFRQTPASGLEHNGIISLSFCSQIKGVDGMTYGSKAGEIEYLIPVKWDANKLKQMDEIVESINW